MSAAADWPDDRFRALLGSRHPIIAAPMAGAAGVELAVAAIEGGAVGSLPCGLLDAEKVRAQALEVRARAAGPLNLNFFCHVMPEADDESAWRGVLGPSLTIPIPLAGSCVVGVPAGRGSRVQLRVLGSRPPLRTCRGPRP